MTNPQLRPRRRGERLECAVLDAAWEQLVAHGGLGFTLDAVARRAHTSRPVLARRWPTRADLLIAAFRHRMQTHQLTVPDTGSLRGDVLAALHEANEKRTDVFLLLGAVGMHVDELSITPDEIRERAQGGHRPVMEAIFQNAARRGEVDPSGIPAEVILLPFMLLRHEIILGAGPAGEPAVLAIVDAVFLPLVRAYQHGLGPARDERNGLRSLPALSRYGVGAEQGMGAAEGRAEAPGH